jgi:BON domain
VLGGERRGQGGPDPRAVDAELLQQIRERLRVSTRVADERIEVATRDDDVVLLGAVASPEEATVAGQLAEEYTSSVVNELQVDRGLRDGYEEPPDSEGSPDFEEASDLKESPEFEEALDLATVAQAEDEVLVGSTDMLAGPGAGPTEDLAEALDENLPWSPPDVPQLAPTATEQRGGVPAADRLALSEWEEAGGAPDDLLDEEDRAARDGPSASDDRAIREEIEEG